MTLRVRLSKVYLLQDCGRRAISLDELVEITQCTEPQTLSELLGSAHKETPIQMPLLSSARNVFKVNQGEDWKGKGKQKKRKPK